MSNNELSGKENPVTSGENQSYYRRATENTFISYPPINESEIAVS